MNTKLRHTCTGNQPPPQKKKKSLTQPLVNGNVEKLIFYTFYIFNDTIYLTIVMYISLTNQLNNKLN